MNGTWFSSTSSRYPNLDTFNYSQRDEEMMALFAKKSETPAVVPTSDSSDDSEESHAIFREVFTTDKIIERVKDVGSHPFEVKKENTAATQTNKSGTNRVIRAAANRGGGRRVVRLQPRGTK